jgi:hypothetical protein
MPVIFWVDATLKAAGSSETLVFMHQNYTASHPIRPYFQIFAAVRSSNSTTSLFHNKATCLKICIWIRFEEPTVVQQVNILDMNKGMKLLRGTDNKPAMKRDVR